MTTQPTPISLTVTNAPAPSITSTVVTPTWAKIVFGIVLFVLVLSAVYGVESIIARHDAATAAKDAKVLATVTAQTQTLEAKLTQDESDNAKKDAQYEATILQLTQTINTQNAQLTKQIAVNNTLSTEQTAQAIATKTRATPQDITSTDTEIIVSPAEGKVINNDLDTLNTIQQELTEKETQLTDQTALTTDAVKSLSDANAVITSQKTEITDASKVCTEQITTLKAQARKSKLKWFGIGFLAGAIVGEVVRIGFFHTL